MKKNLKTLAFLTAFILLGATSAFAGDSIFDAVNHKIVDILLNLQQVIYIIGGFGLIAFAFAAVFGKISFRHLSYLSFSLFLVATMGLFVRYITGDENAMKSLNYTDYCETHDCNEEYVVPDDCDGCDQPDDGDGGGGGGKGSNTIPDTINMLPSATITMPTIPNNPFVNDSTDDENNKTIWDQIQGIIDDVNHGVNTVQTLYGAGVGAVQTVQGVVNGIKNAGDGFGGAMNAMGAIGTGLGNLGGLVNDAGGAINSWMNDPNAQNTYNGIAGILGGAGGAIGSAGYAGAGASNAIGSSNGKVGGGLNAAGIAGQGLQNIFNGVRGAAGAAGSLGRP